MTRPWCDRCGFKHHSAFARAIGIFSLPTPLYTANYPDAPKRATRAEAEHDMCTHRKDTR